MQAYKLFQMHPDGIGPLFINKHQRIPIGVWLESESHPTRGFQVRPGWHAVLQPVAPHLSKIGRIWCQVQLEDVEQHERPQSQGGTWLTARRMMVEKVVTE